jgi:predicted permease
MPWLYNRTLDKLFMRLRSVTRQAEVDAQLDAELAFHLEQQIQENLAAGMQRDEAECAARRTIGGLAQIKDQCRDTRRVAWITDVVSDIRFALRLFAHSPVFCATIVGTLTLGIGANVAVFSIADALLLRKLPVPHPEELVQLLQPDGPLLEEYGERFSANDYRSLRDAARPFGQLAAETGTTRTSMLAGNGEEPVHRDIVSRNYFDVLEIPVVMGSSIGPDASARQAVISYSFWKRRFDLDPHVLGRNIRIGADTFEIAGVTRAGFFGLEPEAITDIWTTVDIAPGHRPSLRVIGRLNPGATSGQLFGPLQALFHQHMLTTIGHPPPDTPAPLLDRLAKLTLKIVPASKGFSALRLQYGNPLRIVFAIVGMVLLVACLNVASLMIARAAARQRELAVRASLGAGRWRLLRQLLAESLLLAVPSALFGMAAAYGTTPLLVKLLAPAESPIQLALNIDGHLLAFTAAVCMAATLVFGLVPAWRAANADVNSALKTRPPQMTYGAGRSGKLIVASQVALSLVLLVAATLFVRTLHYLSTFDIGFERRHVIVTALRCPGVERSETLHQLWEDLLLRVGRIPGVESASLSSGSVFDGASGVGAIRFFGVPVGPHDLDGTLLFQASANFFHTVGTPVLAGRDFAPRDFDPGAPPVAIVSSTFARLYFGSADPIGKRFSNFEDVPPRWITIVGVAKDTRHDSLRSPLRPIAYLPYTWPRPSSVLSLSVSTHLSGERLGPELRTAAAAISPSLSVGRMASQERLIDDSLVREKLLASTSSTFAALALIMAGIGLYGLINYAVARRTQEIGIRMAIGATPRDVVRMILGESILTIAAGILAGLALSAAVVQWISSLLFGVGPQDPATILAAIAVLTVSALVAAWIPARRAAGTDPVAALRNE